MDLVISRWARLIPATPVGGGWGQLEMFRMIDQNGLAISRPRATNLKMALSLFDFNRKKRLLLKWIVTAKFRDNRLAVTRLYFLKQTTESLAGSVWIVLVSWFLRLSPGLLTSPFPPCPPAIRTHRCGDLAGSQEQRNGEGRSGEEGVLGSPHQAHLPLPPSCATDRRPRRSTERGGTQGGRRTIAGMERQRHVSAGAHGHTCGRSTKPWTITERTTGQGHGKTLL